MDRIAPPGGPVYPTSATVGPLRTTEHLKPVSTIHGGRIWSLHVVQQPIRARMCGFGDKVDTLIIGGWMITNKLRTDGRLPRLRVSD